MEAAILGWILIVIGVVSTIAGVAGGIVQMIKDMVRKGRPKGDAFSQTPIDFVKALSGLLEALIMAPAWLALVIIGFVLIAWGGTLIG